MIGAMITLLATHHANERARERIGWHRRTLDRMLERVFTTAWVSAIVRVGCTNLSRPVSQRKRAA